MKTLKTKCYLLLPIILGALIYSCSKNSENVTDTKTEKSEHEANSEQVNIETIEHIDLGNGEFVNFLNVGDEGIAIEMNTNLLTTLPEDKLNLNPIKFYEFLTKREAPSRLVNSYNLSRKKNNEEDLYDDEPYFLDEPDNDFIIPENSKVVKQHPRDIAEFRNKYCNRYCDFNICLTERTGDLTFKDRVYKIRAVVKPYRGQVNFIFRFKNGIGIGWNTIVNRTVRNTDPPYGIKFGRELGRKVEVKIRNAEGDGYHFAAVGIFPGATVPTRCL